MAVPCSRALAQALIKAHATGTDASDRLLLDAGRVSAEDMRRAVWEGDYGVLPLPAVEVGGNEQIFGVFQLLCQSHPPFLRLHFLDWLCLREENPKPPKAARPARCFPL